MLFSIELASRQISISLCVSVCAFALNYIETIKTMHEHYLLDIILLKCIPPTERMKKKKTGNTHKYHDICFRMNKKESTTTTTKKREL